MSTDSVVITRSWPARHWKLLVALAVVLLAALGAGFFFSIMSLMRNSTPVEMGLKIAETNQALIGRIGQPIKAGWYMAGSIEVNENTGSADMSMPLSGPKGSGRLYLEASKHAGLWTLDVLEFVAEGSHQPLNLLEPPPTPTTTKP